MWRKNCRNHRWEKPSELNLLGLKFIWILLTGHLTNAVTNKALSRHHISATLLHWDNIRHAEWGLCFSAVWTHSPSGHPGILIPMARQSFLQLCFSRQIVGNYHLDIWKVLQYCKMQPHANWKQQFLKILLDAKYQKLRITRYCPIARTLLRIWNVQWRQQQPRSILLSIRWLSPEPMDWGSCRGFFNSGSNRQKRLHYPGSESLPLTGFQHQNHKKTSAVSAHPHGNEPTNTFLSFRPH